MLHLAVVELDKPTSHLVLEATTEPVEHVGAAAKRGTTEAAWQQVQLVLALSFLQRQLCSVTFL